MAVKTVCKFKKTTMKAREKDMISEEDFNIILQKNWLARGFKEFAKERKYSPSTIEGIIVAFESIEKKTGTANQPTAREILESKTDI